MRMSVLSINGNKPFNYILQTVLSKDFNVFVASDPISGLKQMKKIARIGLVIVDVDAYEEDAFEFIGHINSSLLLKVPVVLLTSNTSHLIKQKISHVDVSHFFVKPFNPLDLVKKVSQTLSSTQAVDSKA